SISGQRLPMSAKAASSPARSENVVKPTTSVNRTVICRRSASIGFYPSEVALLGGSFGEAWVNVRHVECKIQKDGCQLMALLGPREMSDLSPQSDPKRTLLGRSHLSRFYEYA